MSDDINISVSDEVIITASVTEDVVRATVGQATTDYVVGIPAGGTSGTVLKKVTGNDYDVAWLPDTGGGSGSVAWGAITGNIADQTDLVAADAATLSSAQSYADSKVIDSIADADTTHAPSRNAVFDALAGKMDVGSVTQYTDEMAQDAIGAMVNSTLVYTDATPSLSRAALTGAITAPIDSNTTSLGSFTTAQLNTALSDNDIATGGGVITGTSSGTNTGDDKTAVTGVLKGNGTTISAAVAGTDYVEPNVAITGATKTKVTYDSKGLVTGATDATTEDIAPSTNRRYVTDSQQTNLGSMMVGITGVLTGGVVSINADPTKINVTAGTGCFIDWVTTPGTPIYRPVSWSSVTGLTVNVAGGAYSYVEVTDVDQDGIGTIVATANKTITAEQRRNSIRLATVSHSNLTSITSVSRYQVPAWQTLDSIIDYISAAGSINSGNTASANGANLQINKASGTTTGLFLNYGVNPNSPSIVVNNAVTPVSWVTSRRNGSGGFVYSALTNILDPDLYDTGAASLTTVANNKFTIRRIYFGGASDVYTITYGQAEYPSISAAEASIFGENPVLNPQVTSSAKFVTALIVKKGCTDLSDTAQAKFVNIVQQATAGNSGGDVIADDLSTTAQNIVAYSGTTGRNITELTGSQGDILYHNGTSWAKLPAGQSGFSLRTYGAGQNPLWSRSLATSTTMSFGSGDTNVSVFVSDTSITSNDLVMCSITDGTTMTAEDAAIQGITATASISAGSGYTIYCSAPNGAVGNIKVISSVTRI